MAWVGGAVLYLIVTIINHVIGRKYDNSTLPSNRQLLDFKLNNPEPIGPWTLGSGAPVEIREVISTNSDLFRDELFFESQLHLDGEIIPHRTVESKGVAAWGYFEVTNDVSKYTKADVFNGVGKRTQALARLSVGSPGTGGNDLGRDFKDLAVKLYTKEGILDILSLQTPVFAIKDPLDFPSLAHASERRNPKTYLLDYNMLLDFVILKPSALTTFFILFSDNGIPNGWRHSDFFPIHPYEFVNNDGQSRFAKLNWRTEHGVEFLTTQQIRELADPDYYVRDLYNSIANKSYPCWRLEMDVLSYDLKSVNFNPFDLTRLWPNGTYQTVTIGRLVLNQHSENQFRDAELAAFKPSNLVPGIPGPTDLIFRARRLAYRDTQNHRLGRNHFKTGVNSPNFVVKSYVRDGLPPVNDNGRDSPIYYPNSFSGPIPSVDDNLPREIIRPLNTNAVDLQEPADFYNKVLPDDAARQRLADNLVMILVPSFDELRKKTVKLLSLVDEDLVRRVVTGLHAFNIDTGYQFELINRDLFE